MIQKLFLRPTSIRSRIEALIAQRRRKIIPPLQREILRSPKEKCQPLSQDGWLFFFVADAAEGLSFLKEAGDNLCVCSGQSQKVFKSLPRGC